jgi:hypothetical protein
MDHQGPGRTRPAADTRRQAPWPWPASTESRGDSGDPVWPPENGIDHRSGPNRATAPQPALPLRYGANAAQGTGASRAVEPASGTHGVIGPRTGPQRMLRSGTGPQRTLGTGPQPALGSGSGAQPVLGGLYSLGRTPVRGFPPGREAPEPATGGFSPWHTPREPLTDLDGEDAADGGYGADGHAENRKPPDDTDPMARVEPRTPMTPAGRRRPSARVKPKRSRKSRAPLLATMVAVVVAAAGFGGYKFLYEPRVNAPVSPTLRLPTNVPGSPDFDQSLGKWQHIGTRTEDPAALTIEGLYPPQFVLNGSSYGRTAASVTKSCTLAVYGANLQAALQSGHCNQVVRASYLSGNGMMMGTVGVVNLSTSTAAQKAGQTTGPQEIIAPLTAKKGPTKKLGSGTGVVQAEIKGHYLILIWAEFTDLKSPSTSAARQQLEQFAANLVTGTANINLSTRMLDGKS